MRPSSLRSKAERGDASLEATVIAASHNDRVEKKDDICCQGVDRRFDCRFSQSEERKGRHRCQG